MLRTMERYIWAITIVVVLCIIQSKAQTCDSSQFECSNGLCVYGLFECDRDNDCGDYSDEANCTCESYEIKCDNGLCILGVFMCDGDNDCGDSSDEVNCETRTCGMSQFQCDSSRCISSSWICDGDNDCGDYGDEQDCGQTCAVFQFQCGSGQCIVSSWICDGFDDCDDHSDEQDCDETCGLFQFQCDNGQCTNSLWICDGDNDCGDYSDEQDCGQTCDSYQFQCDNGQCVHSSWVCDGDNDCGDYSDEDCGETCDGGFLCVNSDQCISSSWVCDGDNDCDDSSDEINCVCPSDEYTCPDGTCIHGSLVCDHYRDCNDWTDEEGLDCSFQCSPEEFSCDGTFCISPYSVCDGEADCLDESDETEIACNLPRLCGGELTDAVGTFSSPNFPLIYPAAANCTWIIRGPIRSTVQLEFTQFSLEEPYPYLGRFVCFDYLQIKDGLSDPSGGVLCGSDNEGPLHSTGNVLWVQFVTDRTEFSTGFQANYKIVLNPNHPCYDITCENGGTCESNGDGFICLCSSGYEGTSCQTDTNHPCYDITCENGGTCESNGDGFICLCSSGYEGTTCQTDTNHPCYDITCENGGTCESNGDEFICLCPSGYEGTACQTEIALTTVVASTRFVLEEDFVPALLEPSTNEYQKLAADVEMQMTQVLIPIYGDRFISCEVTRFREGSVEVELDVKLMVPSGKPVVDAQQEDDITMKLQSVISDATQSGNLGRFRVREGSVNVVIVSEPQIGEVGCDNPGDIENGFIFPYLAGRQRYSLGQRAEILCRDGFKVDGSSGEIFCTDKSVWSKEIPRCIEKESEVSLPLAVIVGAGGAGAFVIIVLIVVLIIVCRKRSSTPANHQAPTAPAVHYVASVRPNENKGFEPEQPRNRNTYQPNQPNLAFNFGNDPQQFAGHPSFGPPPQYDERPPQPSPRPEPESIYASVIDPPSNVNSDYVGLK